MADFSSMSQEQFDYFLKRLIPGYAADTMLALRLSEEMAIEFAQNQIKSMLTDGLQTPHNYFYAILDTERQHQVGCLWLVIAKRKNGEQDLFIADIQIFEEFRGQSLGTEALGWIENKAEELGCSTISLHVFGHNRRAYALYERLGFSPYSVNMRKVL